MRENILNFEYMFLMGVTWKKTCSKLFSLLSYLRTEIKISSGSIWLFLQVISRWLYLWVHEFWTQERLNRFRTHLEFKNFVSIWIYIWKLKFSYWQMYLKNFDRSVLTSIRTHYYSLPGYIYFVLYVAYTACFFGLMQECLHSIKIWLYGFLDY